MKKILHSLKIWFLNYHISTYLFDLVLLSTLVILFLFKCKLPSIDCFNVTTNIIISLIPALMTIITLAIQIQNEPIYGITLREFERLRKGFYFILVHMVMIFVSIFVFETFFTFVDFKFGLMALNVVSVIYSVIFIFQEIPIFIKSDFFVNRVMKRIISNIEISNQEKYSNGQKAITYMLMTYGLNEAYSKLFTKKTNKKEMLQRLINFELDYYKKVLDTLLDGDEKEKVTYCRVNVIDAVDISYRDLMGLFDKDNELNVSLLDNDYYGLVNLTFCLKKVTDKLGYSDKNNENLKMLINRLHLQKFSKNFDEMLEVYRYLILMSIFTIRNGEKWFIMQIRDTDFAPLFFDIENYPFVYFLTMYMCFFINSSAVSEKEKENIKSFLSENSKGINSAGYKWIDKIRESLRNNMDGNAYLNGIKKIIRLKELIPESYYDITPKYGGMFTIDDSTHFGNKLLFDYCLQILFFNYLHNIKEQDVEGFINSLSIENKKKIFRVFEDKFMNLQTRDFSNSLYMMIFNEQPNINMVFNKLYNAIDKIRTDELTIEYESNGENKFDSNKIENIKKTIDIELPKIFKAIEFNDDSLMVQKDKMLYFSLLLDVNDYDQLLNLYLKHLDSSIDFEVRKEIESKTDSIEISGYKYNKSDIDDIIKFKPMYCGDRYRLDMTITNEQKEAFKSIKVISRDLIPLDTFLQEGAVRLRYVYCPNESIPRRLKDEEIEEMIRRDYPINNGYYRYSKYKGSSFDNFYVTKEKLISYLYDRYVFVPIVYCSKIAVDKSKIKRFVFKD